MSLTTEQQMLVEQRLNNEKKSVGIAYLLWFFFGGLGVHRFYLGRTGSGVAMLLLTILGLVLLAVYVGIFLLLALVIWLIVDIFLIPSIVEADSKAKRLMIANEIGIITAPPPS